MPMTEEKKAEMDSAGTTAEEAIPDDDKSLEAFRIVAQWWKQHVGGAGHRRLGRTLMKYDVVQAGSKGGQSD